VSIRDTESYNVYFLLKKRRLCLIVLKVCRQGDSNTLYTTSSIMSFIIPSSLNEILQHDMSDVLMHISSFLPPEHLVILSMVNKYMKLYVHVHLSNNFAETVNFCLRRYLFHCPEHMRMTLNTHSGVLEGEYTVQTFAEHTATTAITATTGPLNSKLICGLECASAGGYPATVFDSSSCSCCPSRYGHQSWCGLATTRHTGCHPST